MAEIMARVISSTRQMSPLVLSCLRRRDVISGRRWQTTSSRQPKLTSADVDRIIGHRFPDKVFSYTEKDVILYALGVGADEMKFVYENDEDFSVLPTFAVVPALSAITESFMTGTLVPSVDINPAMIVHGEQYIELCTSRLPPSAELESSATIRALLDKKSGALLIYDVETREKGSGRKLAFNQTSFFMRGYGGFGVTSPPSGLISSVPVPTSQTLTSCSEQTSVNQTLLYRLSGDRNPLHIDKAFANAAGFERPILHGLCTLGFTARHILRHYCNNDVTKFKAIKGRFSSIVLPGQTLVTESCLVDRRVHFQSRVSETGQVCLSDSYVDLNS